MANFAKKLIAVFTAVVLLCLPLLSCELIQDTSHPSTDPTKDKVAEFIDKIDEEYQKQMDSLDQGLADRLEALEADYAFRLAELEADTEANAEAIKALKEEFEAQKKAAQNQFNEAKVALDEFRSEYEARALALDAADSFEEEVIADMDRQFAEQVKEAVQEDNPQQEGPEVQNLTDAFMEKMKELIAADTALKSEIAALNARLSTDVLTLTTLSTAHELSLEDHGLELEETRKSLLTQSLTLDENTQQLATNSKMLLTQGNSITLNEQAIGANEKALEKLTENYTNKVKELTKADELTSEELESLSEKLSGDLTNLAEEVSKQIAEEFAAYLSDDGEIGKRFSENAAKIDGVKEDLEAAIEELSGRVLKETADLSLKLTADEAAMAELQESFIKRAANLSKRDEEQQGLIEELRKQIDSFLEKFKTDEAALEEHQKAIEAQKAALAAEQERIEALMKDVAGYVGDYQSHVEAFSEFKKTIQDAVLTLETNYKEITAQVGQLSDKFGPIEEQLKTLGAADQTFQGLIEDLTGQCEKLLAADADLLKNMQDYVAEDRKKAAEVSRRIDGINELISTLQESLKTGYASLDQSIANQKETIAAQQETINKQAETIKEQGATIMQQSETISALNEAIEAMTAALEALEERVAALEQSAADTDGLKDQIGNLSKHLDELLAERDQAKALEALVFTYSKDDNAYWVSANVGYLNRNPLKEITIPALYQDTPVFYIEPNSFAGLTFIEKVTIGAQVIGNSAFAGCTGLKEVILMDTVQKIENRAFDSCPGVTSVHIPWSVDQIGSGAFGYGTGSGLRELYLEGNGTWKTFVKGKITYIPAPSLATPGDAAAALIGPLSEREWMRETN